MQADFFTCRTITLFDDISFNFSLMKGRRLKWPKEFEATGNDYNAFCFSQKLQRYERLSSAIAGSAVVELWWNASSSG